MTMGTLSRTRRPRLLQLLSMVLALAMLGGCAIRLISDYDETVDSKAGALQKDMDTFLTHLETDAGTPSAAYGANKDFYAKYGVDVRAVMVRAQAHPKNDLSMKQYKLMLDNLTQLETMHRGGEGHEDDGTLPKETIPTTRNLFNQAWLAVITLEVAKKR